MENNDYREQRPKAHPINRRTVVAGIAGALPAAAIGAAPAFGAPDAELIALGRELEAFLPRYVPVFLRGYVLGWTAEAIARERVGFPKDRRATEQEWGRLREEIQIVEDETGLTENERIIDSMYDEADRLMDAVNAIPAASEAGLRVKVLNACLTNLWMLWHDPDGFDIGQRELRELVVATCAALGIALPDDYGPGPPADPLAMGGGNV